MGIPVVYYDIITVIAAEYKYSFFILTLLFFNFSNLLCRFHATRYI